MNLRRSIVTIAIPIMLTGAALPALSDVIPPGYRELTPEEAMNIQKALEQSLATQAPAAREDSPAATTPADAGRQPESTGTTAEEGKATPPPAPEPEAQAGTAASQASTQSPGTESPRQPDSTRGSREALLRSMEARRLALRKRREQRLRELEAESERMRQEARQRQQELEREMAAHRERMRREEAAWMERLQARRPTPPTGPYPPRPFTSPTPGEDAGQAVPPGHAPEYPSWPPPPPAWPAPWEYYYPRW